ncbi:MAG: winged helix-turn-helix transcriptional regulator [Planctomycetaceae bacterium]|nr:winged helix-turn-helix transcriptional regulator [Planctomycetaceae bacterium]
MARAATTLDPFNAIAEPKRRKVLETLAGGEQPVNDLVECLGWSQPVVSKHLAVLKEVGLVSMRQHGRQRFYRLNGEALKPVHDWVKTFERFWTTHLDGIKTRAERKQREQRSNTSVP